MSRMTLLYVTSVRKPPTTTNARYAAGLAEYPVRYAMGNAVTPATTRAGSPVRIARDSGPRDGVGGYAQAA
jgi:hypothetical protein